MKTHSRTGVDWLTHSDPRDWLTVVYCLPFITSGCPNGNSGLTTVGYHTNQHWPSHYWLLCNQHCCLPGTQQYRSSERIHGTIRPRLLGNQHSPTHCWLPCNATIPSGERIHGTVRPGYVVTTRVLHSNDGPRSKTSQYHHHHHCWGGKSILRKNAMSSTSSSGNCIGCLDAILSCQSTINSYYTSKLYVQFGVMVSSSGAALVNLIFKWFNATKTKY
jgi:hypothetical protein